jgi:hypothetical protein
LLRALSLVGCVWDYSIQNILFYSHTLWLCSFHLFLCCVRDCHWTLLSSLYTLGHEPDDFFAPDHMPFLLYSDISHPFICLGHVDPCYWCFLMCSWGVDYLKGFCLQHQISDLIFKKSDLITGVPWGRILVMSLCHYLALKPSFCPVSLTRSVNLLLALHGVPFSQGDPQEWLLLEENHNRIVKTKQ